MLPVLFSSGSFSISTLGIFLAAGFLVGIFLVWRLCRAWDLNEEKVLDLILLTLLGGFICSRVFFILENPSIFGFSISKWLFIFKYPGFSYLGGILGAIVSLYYNTKRARLNLLQIADIASVGLIGGLIFADLGCFLGGCEVGVRSNFLGVTMVGAIGKRFPVQLFEAIALGFSLGKIWGAAIHFHPMGKIVGLALLFLGVIKLLLEPLKEAHGMNTAIYFVITFFAIVILYKVTRRDITKDLVAILLFIPKLLTSGQTRKKTIGYLRRTWYNQKVSFSWRFRSTKKLLRRINVKFS